MSKLALLSLTMAVTLLSTGCSPSNDPKEIALELCEYSKKMDIASIKFYANEPLKAQLTELEKMIDIAKSSEKGAKIYKEQIAKFSEIDCKQTTKIIKNADNSYRVENATTQQFYTLKQVEGMWKMFK